jgi:hypothetical protein
MDVNEQIINEWLHLCKNCFTITNISFKVYGPKGGSNYSNIDILAVDKDGNFYDYEIKWRSVYAIGATDKETVSSLIKQMIRKERVQKIKEIIGNKHYQKILVTTKILFGKMEEKRNKIIEAFEKKRIQILFFEDIIPELVKKVKILGRYDSQILQIIRMIKQLEVKLEN